MNPNFKRAKAGSCKKTINDLNTNLKSTMSLLFSIISRITTKMQLNNVLHNAIEYLC